MLFLEQYEIISKICETSHSLIYKAEDIHSKNLHVIIKMEKNTSNNYLMNETKIRKYLEDTDSIPTLKHYGIFQTRRFIIYPFIDKCLQKFWMNEKMLFNCGHQLLSILENIHKKGVVHCDISATNILYKKCGNRFYLNDFGQSQHYSFALQERREEKLKGCPMFCSLNVHKSLDYSPRDDLVSLGFVLVYCFRKGLRWCGLNNCNQIYEKKMEFKENFWKEVIPNDLKIYFNYCFHLGINEKPDYEMLKKLFSQSQCIPSKEINLGT